MRGRQAWVHVSYCIAESGAPQNIVVLDSVGTERFEREALRSVAGWEFEPALKDGKPSWQSRNQTYISFAIEDSNTGARHSFIRRYKEIGKLIDD